MLDINLLSVVDEHGHALLKRIQLLLAIIFLFTLLMHLFLRLQIQQVDVAIQQLIAETKTLQADKAPSHEFIEGVAQKVVVYHDVLIQLVIGFTTVVDPNVCLSRIEHRRNIFYFSGIAQSMYHVTQYIKALTAANLFSELQLERLEQQKNHFIAFRLRASEKSSLPVEV